MITKNEPVRVNPVLQHPEEKRFSLNGQWSFCLDPDEKGLQERWFEMSEKIQDPIIVPGCWQGQGFGNDTKDTLWDFGLEARVFQATYKGTGWYYREFKITEEWKDSRIQVNFGGVHPSAEVWLNGNRLGENDLPFVPFGFDVTDLIRYDWDNQLVVRVNEKNRLFGLAFNWQGNWSGLYGGVELVSTGVNHIERCEIIPDVDAEKLSFRIIVGGEINNISGLKTQISCRRFDSTDGSLTFSTEVSGNSLEFDLPVPSPSLWSPDTPNLYQVDVVLTEDDTVLDARSERVGFVKLSSNGNQFLINNEPYYLRGSGDFVSCPETGCPDTDRDRWRKKLQTLRDYGYNYIRCQSYVYLPEYYDIADEVGLLIQSEMGMLGAWGSQSKQHIYQWPAPTPDHYPILKRQWDLIVHRDINHPSANFYCMSNELTSGTFFPRIAWRCYRDTKVIKPTAFVIWTDGGYHEEMPGDFVNVFSTQIDCDLKGRKKRENCSDKPVIEHEFRWWSSFPDVGLMDKYSGAIRPYAAEMAREVAAKHDLIRILPEAAKNSQRLQFLEAKGKMEMCRRDYPFLSGLCHFNAMDANPSPQGIINEFYERKYADAGRWQQTNGDTVILSSLTFDDRVKVGGNKFTCGFTVSDFSHPPIVNPLIKWRLLIGDETVESGELTYEHQPFTACQAGEISIRLPKVTKPENMTFEATLVGENHTVKNQWMLWILPQKIKLSEKVIIYGQPKYSWLKDAKKIPITSAETLDSNGSDSVILTEILNEHLVRIMADGGKVVLAATEGLVRPHHKLFGCINYFFTPPANYAPYEDGQNGTIIQNHPMLGDLPHEGFADLQFFRLMEYSPPVDLVGLGLHSGDPVIRVIHRYPVFHPLGYLMERRYGKGGLIISGLDLNQKYPEAKYLLQQMCNYAATADFNQVDAITETSLNRLIEATSL